MSVMCADAMTRGVEVKSDKTCLALPYYLDTDRDNCYTHIYEYFKKIGADLKKLGVWVTDVQESRCHIDIGTPSTGVQESNIKKLRESWHRWNPLDAPMPDSTEAIWPELLSNGHFHLTDSKDILWDKNAWLWKSPTWYISGVSAGITRRALLVSKQDCDKSSSTTGEYEY